LLVSKLLNRNIRNETVPESWYEPLMSFGTRTNSGEIVTPEGAFGSLGTVFACVNIRANAMKKLPLQLFKYVKNGRERDKSHKLWYLLEKRPNKYQSPSQMWSYIELCRMLWGNAYVLQEFDRLGNHTALKPLEPSRVEILMDDNTGEYVFRYTNRKGEQKIYLEEEIWHFPYVSPDGKTGKSPLTVARENAGNLMAIQKFEGNFYKNGTLSQGVLKTDQQLSREDKTFLQEQWQLTNAGGVNAGKIPILDFGLEYKELTMPLKDAEFVMSKKMNQVEIANIFNVPIFMLNDMEKATFNNFEQMKLLFAENVILPEVISYEQEINYKSFTMAEQKKYYVKFNVTSALRGDAQSRVNYYKGMMEIGGLTPNQILKLEDFNPSELPESDKYYMTRNLAPLEAIKDNAMGGGGGIEEP
jgi:HK97 family phage portal protein